jgi:hypothetical protein
MKLKIVAIDFSLRVEESLGHVSNSKSSLAPIVLLGVYSIQRGGGGLRQLYHRLIINQCPQGEDIFHGDAQEALAIDPERHFDSIAAWLAGGI